MKKNKMAKEDFQYSFLPQNRKEVFFDVIKIHWRTLILIAIFLFIAILPFLITAFIRDNYALALSIKVSEGTMSAADRTATLKVVHIIVSLIMWACLYFFAIIMGGIIRIIRQLIWQEPLFFKEDFIKGIKNNFKAGMITATIGGLIIVISKLMLLIGNNVILQSIPMALFLTFVAPPLLLTYAQSTIYSGKFFRLYKNSILMYVKDALRMLLFSFIVLLPFGLAYINTLLIVKYIVALVLIIFVCPFLIVIYYLFTNYMFDKYINQYSFPEQYKKGIYDPHRLDK